MRETRIMDNLNCKTQAHASVCKQNKELEKEKMTAHYNNFMKDQPSNTTLETLRKWILVYMLTYDDTPQHKGTNTVC